MAYTQNESIDWLTAITPTTDDLVVTMDQAEVWVAKTSTLASIYNLFKTTYDTVYESLANKSTSVTTDQASNTKYPSVKSVYDWATVTFAKYLGDADFYQYSIVTSVSSGNLTVALKNYEGNNPTPTKPVKYKTPTWAIKTITSACQATFLLAWTNWWNTWSTELATREVDWFVYILDYNNAWTSFNLWISRYPLYQNLSEATWSYTSEKYLMQSWNIWNETTTLIGRFNATLSAGAGYTWTVWTTIINQPMFQTRYLDYVPVGTGYTAWWAKYRIDWNNVNVIIDSTANITGNITVPFTCTNTVDNQMITNAGTAVLPKNSNTITVATNPQNISWFYWI